MPDTFQYPDARLIIFAKAPVPGQCNTRLANTIGDQAAAELQAELIKQRVADMCQAALCPVELWCSPDDTHPLFQQMRHRFPVSLAIQSGADLGSRMFMALSNQKATYNIIIGTDCPVLRPEHIKETMMHLQEGSDLVIGPAEDGGYVLLGLQKIYPSLFKNIHWGSDQVYQQTLAAARSVHLGIQNLQTLWDIDQYEDYLRFRKMAV